MEESTFLKKYLGEVTLTKGEHVKFLFPITEADFCTYKIESAHIYRNIQKNPQKSKDYYWVLMDNLNKEQFQIVYTAIKKYGKDYWKLLWDNRNKKN